MIVMLISQTLKMEYFQSLTQDDFNDMWQLVGVRCVSSPQNFQVHTCISYLCNKKITVSRTYYD